MHSTFADTRHLRSLRARFPDLYDFIHDPGHHQQPCVYIRLSPWHTPYYVGATDQDVLRREHSRSRKFLQLLRGRHAFFEPALHYWKRSNTYWIFCAVPVEIKLPVSSVWVQESKWQYLLRPHLNAAWVHRILRKVGFREHLVDFRRHSLSSPTSLGLHKRFRRRLHPDLQRQLRPDALDDIQAHYSILYQLGSNTGASFQVMRDLLSAAFPPTQLYYLLRLAVFVNEPFRSKAQKLLTQVLRKRRLQPPSTLTQLLLPPLHVQNWKALLGTWLHNWIASHRDLFPSLFIPKIRVVETRSATLGDKEHQETPDMGCAPASSRSTPHLTDPDHPHVFGVDRWTRHLPGTYRPCPRLERRIVMLVTTIRELGPNRCWIDYHLLVPLLLARYTVDESQDKRRLRHLIRILMGPYVRIQVPRRSGRRRRWSMVLVNFYKNLPLHFAMPTVNLSRHGHRVSWMKW